MLSTKPRDPTSSSNAMESDQLLVERVLSGDRIAFRCLYDRYAALVRRICYDGTGSLADAQDLTQEVFVRVYKKLGSLKELDKFGPWLAGIARRIVIDWQRRKGRDKHDFVEHVPEDISTAKANDDDTELLRQTICELPEKERMALHLFYLQEESVESAREVLGLSRSGFYRMLDRARTKLGELMATRTEGDGNV